MSFLFRPFRRAAAVAVLTLSTGLVPAAAEDAAATQTRVAILADLRDAALRSDYAMEQLTLLSDTIGPRLTGSRQAAAAVTAVAAAMRTLGAQVSLQPVKVPHWQRGDERAELVDYPGRPEGISQRIVLTALGGSAATPAKGLKKEVLVIRSLAELSLNEARVRDRIVLIDVPFDQSLADNDQAGAAYVPGLIPRLRGPAAAARLGAAAVLVRAIGGAHYRLPHAGDTRWEDGGRRVPAAAITVEDALLIGRLAAKGPVTMQLVLTPKTLPDADSHNVIADWRGSERPDEVVVVSGHLDSWDLGTGAADDGAGVVAAMATLRLLKDLGLKPKRTIRFVAFMNEENGLRGSAAYFAAGKDALANQIAAIESDTGAGRPLGFDAYVTPASLAQLEPLRQVLATIGAPVIDRHDRPIGADISPLQAAGVPGFQPKLDTRHYFDYHHSAADTLDKVDPELLRRNVAVMSMLAWWLADMPEPLERLPVTP